MIRIVPQAKRRADVGSVFGRWTVIGEPFYIDFYQWAVLRCECGVTRVRKVGSLLNGQSTSCGCYQKEVFVRVIKARARNLTKNRWRAVVLSSHRISNGLVRCAVNGLTTRRYGHATQRRNV